MTSCPRKERRAGRFGRLIALAALAAASIVGALPSRSGAALIRNFSLQPFYFSPSRGDSVNFRYELDDTADVFVLVFEKDSLTIVDTLLAGVEQLDDIEHRVAWHGRYFDGSPAPEDTFVAFVRAVSNTGSDSLFSQRCFIDETAPQISITLVDPGLIAPGSSDPAASEDVEVSYTVSDPPPGDSLEVSVVIRGPSGDVVEEFPERLVAANLSTKAVWNGDPATDDGLHQIEIAVRDRASNTASARGYVDVDIAGPTIGFTNISGDTTVRVVPDSLFGWAWDRSAVRDTAWVEYPGNTVFVPAPTNYLRSDTLFFAIGLRDSIDADGTYLFRVKAADDPGQETLKGLNITLDATAPGAPVLDTPPAVSHSARILLDGTVGGTLADVLRIYRNGALADSVFANIEGQWPYPFELEQGPNEIYATLVDGAGNASAPSNTIHVEFDPSVGLYVPQPFHPGDSFQFNVSDAGFGVTLRLYDMGGHLVRIFSERWSGEFVSFPWDGLNGDGEKVHKGPLVAVAYVEASEGSNQIVREIFLFEP
jgi:hypothetical protein